MSWFIRFRQFMRELWYNFEIGPTPTPDSDPVLKQIWIDRVGPLPFEDKK